MAVGLAGVGVGSVVSGGLELVTGGLVGVTRGGTDSEDSTSDAVGAVCMLTISPGCVELQGAVRKLKVGLVDTRFEAKR